MRPAEIVPDDLTHEEVLAILGTGEFFYLNDSLRSKLSNFRKQRHAGFTAPIEMSLAQIDPKPISLMKAVDTGILVFVIEWCLITGLTMSIPVAAVSVAITAILSLTTVGISYYFRTNSREFKKEGRKDNLFFTQLQATFAKTMCTQAGIDTEDDPETSKSPPSECYLSTKIQTKTFKYEKQFIPSFTLAVGFSLTFAWGLPSFLPALGASAAMVSAFAPVCIATFCVIGFMLTADLYLNYSQHYQAKAQYENSLLANRNNRFRLMGRLTKQQGKQPQQAAAVNS